jgi:hypothetical protein
MLSEMLLGRKDRTLTTVVEDEVIILDLESEEYFGLDGAAKELWQALEEGPLRLNMVLAQWTTLFDNPTDELHQLIMETVEQLQSRNLLVAESDAHTADA